MNNGEFYLADAIEVIEEILNGGGEFRMYPKGTSMLPLIVQGKDSVVLRKRTDRPEQPAKKHDIAFYRRSNGQFVLHRVMKRCKDGTYVMCGDNQVDLETGIRPEQIIGYTHQIYKEEKLLSLSSFRYKIYCFFWTCMPYRRGIRFLKRCLSFIKRKLLGNK
ncbi:MAG: hypothetical protein E7668_00575 [Ruminococcaceae bacterium]|nr:hypothetical protein [Oscillospiraceae bacterium]